MDCRTCGRKLRDLEDKAGVDCCFRPEERSELSRDELTALTFAVRLAADHIRLKLLGLYEHEALFPQMQRCLDKLEWWNRRLTNHLSGS
jgi:hypothetical protein